MKKSVILIVLLMISFSLVSAKTVDVPGVKQGELIPEGGLPESLIQEGITRYVYSGSSLVASQDNDGIKYYHQDRLSNRIVTDSLGNKDGEYLSLPFGQSVVDGVKYGFTGKELDSSGLHYFGARYYDSNLGRFSSRDPVVSEPAYQYVGNNPMNFVDPSGMDRYSTLTGDYSIAEHYHTATFPYNYISDITGSKSLGVLGAVGFMIGHEWREYNDPAMYHGGISRRDAGYSFGEFLNNPDTSEDLRLGVIGLAVEVLNLPISIETDTLSIPNQDNPFAALPYNERVFFGSELGSFGDEDSSLMFGLVAGHNRPSEGQSTSRYYTSRGVGFGFSTLGSHGQVGNAGDFLGFGARIKRTLFSIDSLGMSFPAYGLFSINQPREGNSYGQFSGGIGVEFNDWRRFPIQIVSTGDSIGFGVGGSF